MAFSRLWRSGLGLAGRDAYLNWGGATGDEDEEKMEGAWRLPHVGERGGEVACDEARMGDDESGDDTVGRWGDEKSSEKMGDMVANMAGFQAEVRSRGGGDAVRACPRREGNTTRTTTTTTRVDDTEIRTNTESRKCRVGVLLLSLDKV